MKRSGDNAPTSSQPNSPIISSRAQPNLTELLRLSFEELLSFDRDQGRENLSKLEKDEQFASSIFQLIVKSELTLEVRLAAAEYLTEYLSIGWLPSPHSSPISSPVKNDVQMDIVNTIISSSGEVQSRLKNALTFLSKHDFTITCPEMIPTLSETLSAADDIHTVHCLLVIVDTLFGRLKSEENMEKVLRDAYTCSKIFSRSLLLTYEKSMRCEYTKDVDENMNCMQVCCRILFSMNYHEMSVFCEMDKWLDLFKSNFHLDRDGEQIELHAAIIDNLRLFAEKSELFRKDYLNEFMGYVLNKLKAVFLLMLPSSDALIVAGIKFLTVDVCANVVAKAHILDTFDNILFPAMMIEIGDEYFSDEDYVEYIRREIEEVDTRRRVSCQLLMVLSSIRGDEVADVVQKKVMSFLDIFAENPATNMKYKDCAISLVVSLSTTSVSSGHLSIVDHFVASYITPELKSQNTNEYPILKASALKFFTVFFNQISKPDAMALFPDVVRFLCAEPVHSYAASCIEKLIVKDDGDKAGYTPSDISSFLPTLMINLFSALEKPKSVENQYVMKCIVRVLEVANISPDVASLCLTRLTSILNKVFENLKDTVFNRYVLEAVISLVRWARLENNVSIILTFESRFSTNLQDILPNVATKFFPSIFVFLAQLVELKILSSPLSSLLIVDVLGSIQLWKKSPNVPGLVMLFRCFLEESSGDLIAKFLNNLFPSSSAEHGFYVLTEIVKTIELTVLEKQLGQICSTLAMHYLNGSSLNFDKSLVKLMSSFLVKHGPITLLNALEKFQMGSFKEMLQRLWIPTILQMTGSIEIKLVVVATTKLIVGFPFPSDPSEVKILEKLVDNTVTILSRQIAEETEILKFEKHGLLTHTYQGKKKEKDHVRGINPKEYFVYELAFHSLQFPDQYEVLIQNLVNQENFRQLFARYRMSLF